MQNFNRDLAEILLRISVTMWPVRLSRSQQPKTRRESQRDLKMSTGRSRYHEFTKFRKFNTMSMLREIASSREKKHTEM